MHPVRPVNLILKALLLFLILNLLLSAISTSGLGNISAYNFLIPGRERLPFGESPREAYNFSLYDLNAMFKSLALAGKEKTREKYRVLVIGDSSVWGTLLRPEETLAGRLNSANLKVCGKQIEAFNLGYPTISLMKDLLLIDRAKQYLPDQIIWLTTLEAFPKNKQLNSPLVANNAETVRELISRFELSLDPKDSNLVEESFFDKTILGKRRQLMDLVRLQLYGVMWGATGIDQLYPTDYQPAAIDLEPDEKFNGMVAPLDTSSLSLDILKAGISDAGEIPVMLINEPILISPGKNRDIRYNFFYPRWAYDQYREMLGGLARDKGWDYKDLWNLVPATEFTNSAIHLTPAGETLLADEIGKAIVQSCRLK
jgi:hypothetical protein